MFGNQGNPSFGGGGFGQSGGQGGSSFGATGSVGGFGGGAVGGGGFGQQQQQNTQAPSPFGGGGGQTTSFGSPSFGGASAPGGNAFGGSQQPGGFGTNQAAFGASNQQQQPGAFGQSTGAFGQSAGSVGGAFGGGSGGNGAFGGGGGASNFGRSASATSGLSSMGSSNTGSGAFGSAAGGATGGFGGFGSTTNQSPNQPGAFGVASGGGIGSNTNAFGSMNKQPSPIGGGFGSGTQGGGFGSGSSAFGSATTTTSAFGAPQQGGSNFAFSGGATQGSSPFGQTSAQQQPGGVGAFGAPAGGMMGGVGGFGQGPTTGTGIPPFKPFVSEEKSNGQIQRHNIQVITAMPEYEGKSLEELRMEDYRKPDKGMGQQQPAGFGAASQTAPSGFGSSAQQPNSGIGAGFGGSTSAFGATGAFGAAPSGTGGFGGSTGGFGATTGATTTGGAFGTGGTSGGFGQPAGGGSTGATGAFGAAPSGTGGFGGSTGGFGATTGATTTGGAFGTGGTSGGFGQPAGGGSTGATGAFGAAPSGTGGFGGSTGGFGATTGATTTGGAFGTGGTSGGFGQPAGGGSTGATGAFGAGGGFNKSPGVSGGFGGSTGAFGSSAFGAGSGGKSVSFAASPTSGFGPAAAKPGFSATAPGAFGSAPTSTTGAFGSTPTPGSAGGFGSTSGGFGAQASSFGGAAGTLGLGAGASGAVGSTGSFGSVGGFGSASAAPGGFGSPPGGGFGAAPNPALSTGFAQPTGQGQAVQQPLSSALVVSGQPMYEGTGYASLASSQSGLDGFQRVSRLTERTQRHLDMRLTADQSGDYQLGNEQSGFKKDYPSYRHPSAGTTAHIDSSIVIKADSPPGRAGATPRKAVGGKFGGDSAASGTSGAGVDAVDTGAGASASSASSASSSSASSSHSGRTDDPFKALARLPVPVAAMQGKSNVVEGSSGSSNPPTPHANPDGGADGGEKTGLTPVGTNTPNVVEEGVDLDLGEGCITVPAIRVLEALSRRELQAVADFQVSRPGFGSVQWQEPVDLTDVRLSKAVQFYQNGGGWAEVSVHDDDSEEAVPEGQKLNRRALVTLLNYFPRKEWSDEKRKGFGKSLKAYNEKNGATFCNYDADRGEWQFFVAHFSRWGFDDSFLAEVGAEHGSPAMIVDRDKDRDRDRDRDRDGRGGAEEEKGSADTSRHLNSSGSIGKSAENAAGRGSISAGARGSVQLSPSPSVDPFSRDDTYTHAGRGAGGRTVNFAADPRSSPSSSSSYPYPETAHTPAASLTPHKGRATHDPGSPVGGFAGRFAGHTPFKSAETPVASTRGAARGTRTGEPSPSPFSKFINHRSLSASAGAGAAGQRRGAPGFAPQSPLPSIYDYAASTSKSSIVAAAAVPAARLPGRISPARLRGERSADVSDAAPVLVMAGESANTQGSPAGGASRTSVSLPLAEPEPALVRFSRSQLPADRFAAFDGTSPTMSLLLQAKREAGVLRSSSSSSSGPASEGMPGLAVDLTRGKGDSGPLPSAGTGTGTDTATATATARRMRDFGLGMRRSFRVGWGRDGRLVHAGKALFVASPRHGDEGEQAMQEEGEEEDQQRESRDHAHGSSTSALARRSDHMYGKTHRVCIEKLDSLCWYRAVERELGLPSSAQGHVQVHALFSDPLRIMLDASELDPETAWILAEAEAPDEADAGPEGRSPPPRTNCLTEVAPLWRLPVATLEDLPRYSLFLTMLRGLSRLFSERRLDRDHPDKGVGTAVDLMMACCGQEDNVIQAMGAKARTVRGVLSGLSSSSPPSSPSAGGEDLSALDFSGVEVGGEPLQSSLLPLYEDSEDYPVCLWERRRELLSRWLQDLAESTTPGDLLLGSSPEHPPEAPAVYGDIFDLLCCHRIEDAVHLALEAGLFRLATVLSQTDGDDSVVRAMRQQLQQWYLSDTHGTIPKDLLDVYRLIGSEFVHRVVYDDGHLGWESSVFAPSRRHAHFTWSQCIGAMVWYGGSPDDLAEMAGLPHASEGCKGKVGTALQRYRAALNLQEEVSAQTSTGTGMGMETSGPPFEGKVVPPPESDFVLEGDEDVVALRSKGVAANHGVFSLLELLLSEGNADAETEHSVAQCVEALRCEGFTRDALDSRGCFIVLALLECIGFVAQSDERACVVRQHFIAQLLSEGLHTWAIFVACQQEDHHLRTCNVKRLLNQWACATEGEGRKRPALDSAWKKDVDFLTNVLLVPASWVYEALAHRAGYDGKPFSQASFLIRAMLACEPASDAGSLARGRVDALSREAHRVICDDIAPGAILRSGAAVEELSKLLALLEREAPQPSEWMERNGIFGDYLSLRARVDAFGKKKSESSDSTERGARIIMEGAAVLLRRLSEHMEVEKVKKVKKMAEDQDSDDDRKRRTGREVGLGHVTLLDMGSYLLSLVVKLIEVEAQQQLKDTELRLQADNSISSAEKDRVFADHAKKSADAVVVQLRSLPTNCVLEGTRTKLETMIGLKQKQL